MPYTAGKYTPVVFITNRTFERISAPWLDTLAERLTKRVAQKTARFEKDFTENYPYAIQDTDYNINISKRALLKEQLLAKRKKENIAELHSCS